jgi:hypothetical protein
VAVTGSIANSSADNVKRLSDKNRTNHGAGFILGRIIKPVGGFRNASGPRSIGKKVLKKILLLV